MRPIKTVVAALLVCAPISFLMALPFQSSPSLAVVSSGTASELSIAKFAVDSHPIFSKWFLQPEWFKDRPYIVLLHNKTTVPITAITVKWSMTDDSGSSKTWSFRSDSYYISNEEVVGPNGEAAVYPSGYIPDRVLKSPQNGFISTGPTSVSAMEGLGRSKVTVTLDVAIFADGRVVGPDEYKTVSMIETRNRIANEMLRYIRNGLAQKRDINSLLTALEVPSAADDISQMATRRLITLMRTAPDVPRLLTQLEKLRAVPRFYR